MSEEEEHSRIIVISSETMRQPTNLELAQLIILAGDMHGAVATVQSISADLLADQGDVVDAIQIANAAAGGVMAWWEALLLPVDDE